MICTRRAITACLRLPESCASQIGRRSTSCLRSRTKTQPRQLSTVLASSSTGGIPPLPPVSGTAVASDDREPKRGPSWLAGAALILVGGTVILVAIAAYEDAAGWKEDTRHASLSIIIPTLNEEAGISACIHHLQALEPAAHQMIVADGGSTDRTVQIAQDLGAEVVECGRGRATQMNAGAKKATGQLLCFVHADNLPPTSLVADARDTLSDGRTVVGGYRVVVEHEGRTLGWMTFHQLIKTYYAPLLFRPLSFARGLRAMFGDQDLFCRRSDFERLGGYDQRLPIMEDLDLIMRLHAAGPSLSNSGTDQTSSAAQASAPDSPVPSGGPAAASPLVPGSTLPFNQRKTMLPPAPIRLRDEDKLRLGRSEAMRELGNKYGAAGTVNQAPNLHEIMAAQSGWAGQRQMPNFASPQAADFGHGQARAPKEGAKVVTLGGGAANREEPGHQPLLRSGFGRRRGARCRGRIKMLLNPQARTSGRRLARWGNLKGTWIHFRLATHWYFGGSVEELHRLYRRLYTDDFR